jgi:hypothetical protein
MARLGYTLAALAAAVLALATSGAAQDVVIGSGPGDFDYGEGFLLQCGTCMFYNEGGLFSRKPPPWEGDCNCLEGDTGDDGKDKCSGFQYNGFDIEDGPLTGFQPGVFNGLDKCDDIQINDNDIASIPNNLLWGMTALKSFSLRGNNITSIPYGAFAGATNLYELELEDNSIADIDPGAFVGLPNLGTLFLFGNELSGTFDPTPFQNLKNPGNDFFLRLDDNRLSSIGPGAFAGISGLGILFLDGNVISSIDDDAFVGLDELGDLDFSNNSLVGPLSPQVLTPLMSTALDGLYVGDQGPGFCVYADSIPDTVTETDTGDYLCGQAPRPAPQD